MNKLTNWLKIKLKKFLDIEALNESFTTHETVTNIRLRDIDHKLKSVDVDIKYLYKDISHLQDSVNAIHNTLESIVHIGTDVRQYNERTHSWAVVCVEGNINIVKFVDLGRQDARSILEYLKHFEAGRHCIDTPYKQMFYDDGLFKF